MTKSFRHDGRPAALPLEPRDVYVACHSNVHGWGGGLAFAAGLADAFQKRGHSSLILGIDDQAEREPVFDPGASRLNLAAGVPRRLWRVQSWCLPYTLANSLRQLPAPAVALVTVSPTWVAAAQRAWSDVPVAFVFACLLSNCLPFTWPKRRPPTFWSRIDYAGLRRAERLAFAQADLILAPTQQSVAEITEFAPNCAARLEPCDYGTCPPDAAPEQRIPTRTDLGVTDDTFLIAAIGHCDRNKAFDLAIAELPQTDPRAHLLVIGSGPEEDRLRHLASELGITHRVTFVRAQREMGPWYAAADCVVSTSFYDTFPNVLTEAMSAGVPILAPRHDPPHVYSGLAEIIGQDGGGWCYDRRKRGALAGCLNRLIREPQTRQRLGEQGQEIARRRFRWTRCVDRILDELGACFQPLRATRRGLQPARPSLVAHAPQAR